MSRVQQPTEWVHPLVYLVLVTLAGVALYLLIYYFPIGK